MPRCDEKIIGVVMLPKGELYDILNNYPMYSREQQVALQELLIKAKQGDREAREKAEYILNNPQKVKSSKRKLKHLTPKKKRRR